MQRAQTIAHESDLLCRRESHTTKPEGSEVALPTTPPVTQMDANTKRRGPLARSGNTPSNPIHICSSGTAIDLNFQGL